MRNSDKLGLLGAVLLLAGSGAVLATNADAIFGAGDRAGPPPLRVASLAPASSGRILSDYLPATDLSGFESQLRINRGELEITNVHLGRMAGAEVAPVAPSRSRLDRVATEKVADFRRPDPPAQRAGDARVLAEAPAQPSPGQTTPDAWDAVSPTADMGTPAPDPAPALPDAPAATGRAGFPPGAGLGETANLSRPDLGIRVPAVSDLPDHSPFGLDCVAELDAVTAPGAMVSLSLNAPCLPNSRVEIRHGKLFFAALTSPSGALAIDVPALEENAAFTIDLGDGRRLAASVHVPELRNFERIAVLWRGALELDLHALEFGAAENSRGHVWPRHPGDPATARRDGGGFLVSLGDPGVSSPAQAEVYTLPKSRRLKSGVVKTVLTVHAAADTCGAPQTVFSVHSKQGRMVGASGYRFDMPACGAESESLVLNNAVRDMIIAAK